MPTEAATPRLIDRFGRQITYVRLSVTDRCDLRCVYCMAEDMTFLPRAQVLTLDEIALVGEAFAGLGVRKFRLTGGEPLRRNNVMHLVRRLGRLDGLGELVMTTNGTRLSELADDLRAAGVRRINVSLDSLQPERFRHLTRVGDLATVLQGIEAARSAGFERIKLNAVILRNRNHDEVLDLARFALERDMDISFIEEMPLGVTGVEDRFEAYYSSEAILDDLAGHFDLVASTETTGGPSRYYRAAGYRGRIGLISPHSHNFCADCNRVRVTAEGKLLLCLGQENAIDLRRVVRANPGDVGALQQAITEGIRNKPQGHEFAVGGQPVILRRMNMTGG
ncbi:MAG: GTP 3',8-cyclase MoaA [Gammaproteobacteria bacterium]|nr:GTP 3',8-cyclase MoaA [Gammaproteobacteria bacterium]